MFRRVGIQVLKSSRSYSSTIPKFTTTGTNTRSSRWVPLSIFGGSFLLGWYFTRHMTFTDLLAYWRYDKLPSNAQEVKDYQNQLQGRLENLNVVKQLKSRGYIEVFPNRRDQDQLIDRALDSPGAIAIPPRFYYKPATKEIVGIYHLGMKLTGYPFIIHGGILATVMEDLMRESVKMIKGKNYEKTKDLNISYKFPTFANQFVIVRTTEVESFGKTIKLKVDVMDQSGNRNLVAGGGVFST